MNIELSEQATLPVAKGGLGIRRSTDAALSAFLSSVAGSHLLVTQLLPQHLHVTAGINDPSFTAAVTEWQSRAQSSSSVHEPFATAQKVWDAPLVNVQESNVLSAAPDQAGKARLIAAAASHSGAFLLARPCASLGTGLDNSSLRIVVALRLGAPVCLPHVCVCDAAATTV